MYKVILFLLLSASVSAQITQQEYRGKQAIVLSPSVASVLEYWGQKGILADPVIKSLETEIKLLETQVELYELVNKNAMAAQEEYRAMVSRSGVAMATLQAELNAQREEAKRLEEKAIRRGKMLIAATAIVGGSLYLILSK